MAYLYHLAALQSETMLECIFVDLMLTYVTFAPRATKLGSVCLEYAVCHVLKVQIVMINAHNAMPRRRFLCKITATGRPTRNS